MIFKPHTSFSAEEIESFRQERIEAICHGYDSTPEELIHKFQPGTLGCHEALHAASLLMDLIDNRLTEHPAVALNAEWHKLAMVAQAAVCDLYRAINEVHMPRDGAP
ncbi:hypothetical protein MRS76_19175 [Rhizobiaceae bacterium n13]|uniref:Uncharacterized protein n=1 Tax=Ferirhizobium litorale TaxID=2927786 RepID=A0AAE3QIE2_9HYPH|nr:hypothetical protein [Fererhizobium litorale]MDI7864074.1 hypothetical protein [Fererhizobium litorale]MDI7924443.1 hypothetical protein [Fererhizobium litorale]